MDNALLQFKQKFIEEATEFLTGLEKDLLALENNPQSKENIEEVFRVMHTLKGVSSMYGYNSISEFTHRLENIYDLIRENKLQIDSTIIDITFDAVDHIKNLLNDENFDQPQNIQTQTIINNQITEILKNHSITIPEPDNVKLKIYPKTNSDIVKTFYILFQPDESLFFRGINIISLFAELSSLGKYQMFKHNFAHIYGIENNSDNSWGIILSTKAEIEEIENVFVWVEDNCKIVKISNQDLFDTEKFLQHLSVEEETADHISDYLNIDKTQIEIATQTQIEQQTQAQHENKIQHQSKQHSRISVDSDKLDLLMYLVSELVTTNAQLTQASKQKDDLLMERVVEKMEKLTKQFRDNALNLRLVPVNDIMIRFQRLIRDLSHQLNKVIRFETHGTETEIDKNVIDSLIEPLMHIIRNCIDHGIETPEKRAAQGKSHEGTIKLSAHYEGTYVVIKIEDDGNGIDQEKIICKAVEKGIIAQDAKLSEKEIFDLIFLPGFSTAESLTQVSGRGVGMDVVRKKITDIRGDVTVESKLGVGTTFIIKLQQTISIIDTLLVKADQIHFMIPVSEIENCDSRTHAELFRNANRQVEYNNTLVPYIHLRNEFRLNKDYPKNERIIVINRNNIKFALVADKIIGEHQAVLKPLGKTFANQQFLMGASIMGDGNMALMLDTAKLVSLIFKNN